MTRVTYIHEVLHACTDKRAELPSLYCESDVDVQGYADYEKCEVTDCDTGYVDVGCSVHRLIRYDYCYHQEITWKIRKYQQYGYKKTVDLI